MKNIKYVIAVSLNDESEFYSFNTEIDRENFIEEIEKYDYVKYVTTEIKE